MTPIGLDQQSIAPGSAFKEVVDSLMQGRQTSRNNAFQELQLKANIGQNAQNNDLREREFKQRAQQQQADQQVAQQAAQDKVKTDRDKNEVDKMKATIKKNQDEIENRLKLLSGFSPKDARKLAGPLLKGYGFDIPDAVPATDLAPILEQVKKVLDDNKGDPLKTVEQLGYVQAGLQAKYQDDPETVAKIKGVIESVSMGPNQELAQERSDKRAETGAKLSVQKNVAEVMAGIAKTEKLVEEIDLIAAKIFTEDSVFRASLQGVEGAVLPNTFGRNLVSFLRGEEYVNTISDYNDMIGGFTSVFAKVFGSDSGALSEGDAIRSKKLAPTLGDTTTVAQLKIERMKEFLEVAKKAQTYRLTFGDDENLKQILDDERKRIDGFDPTGKKGAAKKSSYKGVGDDGVLEFTIK